jgi:hypothetical protein
VHFRHAAEVMVRALLARGWRCSAARMSGSRVAGASVVPADLTVTRLATAASPR